MAPCFIVVFGPVGVGKTTIVDALRHTTEAPTIVREPVDAMVASGALADMYANRAGAGFRLQMLVLAERLSKYWQTDAALNRPVAFDDGASIATLIVGDGHVNLDGQIFCSEHIRNNRMTMAQLRAYMQAIAQATSLLPTWATVPAAYIYLKASPKTCRARAALRDRTEEQTLDAAFFTRMCDACDGLAARIGADVCHTVDANRSAECVLLNVHGIIKHCYDGLYKVP